MATENIVNIGLGKWRHNLNQCWLSIGEVLWYLFEGIFTGNDEDMNYYTMLHIYKIQDYCNNSTIGQWVELLQLAYHHEEQNTQIWKKTKET